jgi:hypothetical protein
MEHDECYFSAGSKILICGASGSGKSSFIVQSLKDGLFEDPIGSIFVAGPNEHSYVAQEIGKWLLSKRSKTKLYFQIGSPSLEECESWCNKNCTAGYGLLILDDLFIEAFKNLETVSLFTVNARQKKITVVITTHALSEKSASHLSVCNYNSNFLVVFKNLRGGKPIYNLGSEIFASGEAKTLVHIYQHATGALPYTYLCIDSRPTSPNCRRFVTCILEREQKEGLSQFYEIPNFCSCSECGS